MVSGCRYDSPIYTGRGLKARLRSSDPDPKVGFQRGHLFYADFDGLSFVFLHKPACAESRFSRFACLYVPFGGLVPYVCLDDVSDKRIAEFVDFSRFCSATAPIVDKLLLLRPGSMRLYTCASRGVVPSSRDISSCLNIFEESKREGYESWMISSISKLMYGFEATKDLFKSNACEGDVDQQLSNERLGFDYLFKFWGDD